ncbi:MAG: PQQ-dependent sugar dehydrogenase [Gemmataceae bacterium]
MLISALLVLPLLLAADPPGPRVVGSKEPLKPVIWGLDRPIAVAFGEKYLYVTVAGKRGEQDGGMVLALVDGKGVVVATGLAKPFGIVAIGSHLYVTDSSRIWQIAPDGKKSVYVDLARAEHPLHLGDIVGDNKGTLYVSGMDAGSGPPRWFQVLVVTPKKQVRPVFDTRKEPQVQVIPRLFAASESHLDLMDARSGAVHRLRLSDGKVTPEVIRLEKVGCIAEDHHGRRYLGNQGDLYVVPRPGEKPTLLASGFQSIVSMRLAPSGKSLLVVDFLPGVVYAVPTVKVDESPLPIEIAPAFADVKWKGWKPVDDAGKPTPFRPILLTHAGDGSNRVFVPTQQGVVHVFPNGAAAKESKVFLDLRDRVRYSDSENEEGFLGLAFHPNYRKNGELFVYYTSRKHKLTNVVSRFKVSKDDPDRADPASEEVLLELPKPFWNHNGGTIAFGPDGQLYLAVGDGGSANDPFNNAQNLGSLLGKILRIDVDRRDDGKRYGVPKDNPFVDTKGARPEVWAYGLRNVWRMAFDRTTGQLWAADVGQNLWEEINRIEKGGNYGWRPREGTAPVRQRRRRAEPRHDRPDLGVSPRRRQVDHRRPRLSRCARAGAAGVVPVRRLCLRPRLGAALRRREEARHGESSPAHRRVPGVQLRRGRARRGVPAHPDAGRERHLHLCASG